MIKAIARKLLDATPYELTRKRLPPSTFNVGRLALAYYFSKAPAATLLQIGAFDGVSGDPVFDLLSQGQTRAVLVEPVESSFRRLEKAYEGINGVSLVQAAIAQEDGNATLYRAKVDGRWKDNKWVGQVTSFDPGHLLKHGVLEDEIEAVTVPALTLPSLLARFDMTSVEFLQVDTEGFDAEVVKMSLKLPICPDIINFEHLHLNLATTTNVFQSLERQGYAWIHSTWDTLAIHERVMEGWKGEKSSLQKAVEHLT